MGWQGSGRFFNPKLLLYRTASSDWESDTHQSPEWQGRIFHGGKIAGVKGRKTPGWNQDVTLGACEVDVKLEGKLLSPNYMAFLPLFWEQDVILWPQSSLILRCFSLLHERSPGMMDRYVPPCQATGIIGIFIYFNCCLFKNVIHVYNVSRASLSLTPLSIPTLSSHHISLPTSYPPFIDGLLFLTHRIQLGPPVCTYAWNYSRF